MEIIRQINWVDIVVLILIVRTTYVALQHGLTHEVFPLIGSIAMLLVSLRYYSGLGLAISKTLFNLPLALSNFFSFLILIIGLGLLCKLVNTILAKLVKVEWHPLIERFGGFVTGLLRGSIIAGITLTVLALLPIPYLQSSIRDRSLIGMSFLRIGPDIYDKTIEFLPFAATKDSKIEREELIEKIASDKYTTEPKMKEEPAGSGKQRR